MEASRLLVSGWVLDFEYSGSSRSSRGVEGWEGERDHHGNEGNRITALCPSGMREARKDCENEVNFTGACPTHGDKFEHVPTTFYLVRSPEKHHRRQIN